jgi:hypothetical protein
MGMLARHLRVIYNILFYIMNELSFESSSAESRVHKIIKSQLSDLLLDRNENVKETQIEKYLGKRYADIYFKLYDGKQIAIEIQNSNISVYEIINRTIDYNKLGIYVLWILNTNGKWVASPKIPKDGKLVKVSPAEKNLHAMYGGRVYYVALKSNDSLSSPFALHYSKPIKRKKRGLFKLRFGSYYIRNVNCMRIDSLKLLSVEFSGHKIARFTDKHVKSALKSNILSYVKTIDQLIQFEQRKAHIIRLILKNFSRNYGKYLILDSLLELVKENEVELDQKSINKIKKQLID